MHEGRYLSTATVSQALGVSVTTVKRWVDEGILPAHKTPGGHRKILLGDVLRLVREQRWPHANLELLTGSPRGGTAAPAERARELGESLERGDGTACTQLLRQAYTGGLTMGELADGVVAPAMAQLGHGWEEGRLDVYEEHRGTQLCLAALLDLEGRLRTAANGHRPLALGGGPEHDHYLLASQMAKMVLESNGWEAVNIGPNTPMASFRRALRTLKPRLLWLSCSHLADPGRFLSEYRELYREAEQAGVAVAVGGRALNAAVRSAMPYTTFGDGLSHLAAFARTLHPAPARPS